jgi:hypothetical protein
MAGVANILFVSRRAKIAEIGFCEGSLTLKSRKWWKTVRIDLLDIVEVRETNVRLSDGLRNAWPSNSPILYDILDVDRPAVRLELRQGIHAPIGSHLWWRGRCRTLVIDPEDRRGFATALHDVAPHVTRDAVLVE